MCEINTMITDWTVYPNFTRSEFACQHCGDEEMQPAFVQALQDLRLQYRRPITITSGYRCPAHPIEQKKAEPGAHAEGCAADIAVSHAAAIELLRLAMQDGRFTGFGVQQKGAGRFIHLDMSTTNRPAIWSY